MKLNIFLATLLSVAFATGCNSLGGKNRAVGNREVVAEKRDLTGFNAVEVSGSGKVYLVQDGKEFVEITTDSNLLPHIETVVQEGVLRIRPEKGWSLQPSQEIVYHIHLKNIQRLQLSGSIQVESESLETESLKMVVSGSGKARIPDLVADRLEFRISGSGHGEFSGEAAVQIYQISGSGDIEASRFKSREAKVNISGSGRVRLWATEFLEARISGDGRVEYYGDPKTDVSASGSGRVRSLGPEPADKG